MQKKKKKILFLTRLYSPHIGGVEKHVEKISEILVGKNYDVTIICEQHDSRLKLEEKKNDITILRIPISKSARSKKFKIWKWMFKNINTIRKFDIIHIHDVFYWILPIAPLLDRKKVFITFHGYESFPIKLSEKIQKKLAAKYCSGSITVGEFINKWYGIASNAVIYGGVADKSIPAKKQNRSKNVNILYIGRLSDDMSAPIYLSALKKLKSENFNFTLTVCGDGKYKDKFEKFGEVKGFVSTLDKHIGKSDIVFASSYLSMLEVLMQKKQIIAAYSSPLKKDYLEKSPFADFITIVSSSDQLFDMIKKEDLKTTIKGYKWALSQTWGSTASKYLKIWKL